MTARTASNLDTEKFRKVHGLMTGGATAGERAAAKARAEAMASKAGMTLADAVSKLDGRPATVKKPKSFFEEMGDAMEAKHPGWKAERATREAERERERYKLRQEALKEFGSEDAVFAVTERERLLRETLEPFAIRRKFSNSSKTYIDGYAGWTTGRPPLELRKVLASAYPFPADIAGVWRERNEWERQQDIRCAFYKDADMPVWVRARLAALEHMLDTMPAPTFEGIATRLAWLEALNGRGYSRDANEDAKLIDALRFDFDTLRQRVEAGEREVRQRPAPTDAPVQNGHRTNAEKRAAVLAMLDSEPGLSDREIARRLGVSPQTVNNWRKRHRP